MTEPLIDRAREAFAGYRGLGKDLIDELIFALTVANAEVASLRASHDRLLEAAESLLVAGIMSDDSFERALIGLRDAVAAAEEQAP